MEGKCGGKKKERWYVNMTVLHEKRKKVYGNTSLCRLQIAVSLWLIHGCVFDWQERRNNIWSADISGVSCTYNAALLTANEIIPIVVVHGSCTKTIILSLNMQRELR